jgi:hypothetical protein
MGPWSLVPGEDSGTGNVTGGRKLTRYVFGGCRWLLRGRISIASCGDRISFLQPPQASIAVNATLKPEPTAGAGFIGLLMGNGTRAPPPSPEAPGPVPD